MMTPFMQMRLWWRRGSVAERSTATLAVLIVVGLAAWVLAPTGSDNTTTVASGNSLQNGSGSRAGADSASHGTAVPGG